MSLKNGNKHRANIVKKKEVIQVETVSDLDVDNDAVRLIVMILDFMNNEKNINSTLAPRFKVNEYKNIVKFSAHFQYKSKFKKLKKGILDTVVNRWSVHEVRKNKNSGEIEFVIKRKSRKNISRKKRYASESETSTSDSDKKTFSSSSSSEDFSDSSEEESSDSSSSGEEGEGFFDGISSIFSGSKKKKTKKRKNSTSKKKLRKRRHKSK